jgi:putative transposase
MNRPLDDVRLAVMMIDGIELKGRTNVGALGITTDGVKVPLGLWSARPRTPPCSRPCYLTLPSATSIPSRASCS